MPPRQRDSFVQRAEFRQRLRRGEIDLKTAVVDNGLTLRALAVLEHQSHVVPVALHRGANRFQRVLACSLPAERANRRDRFGHTGLGIIQQLKRKAYRTSFCSRPRSSSKKNAPM